MCRVLNVRLSGKVLSMIRLLVSTIVVSVHAPTYPSQKGSAKGMERRPNLAGFTGVSIKQGEEEFVIDTEERTKASSFDGYANPARRGGVCARHGGRSNLVIIKDAPTEPSKEEFVLGTVQRPNLAVLTGVPIKQGEGEFALG